MKKPSKCPVCNSTRLVQSKEGMKCKRCGYVHNNSETINKEIEKEKNLKDFGFE
jgi:predicted Zn-ribbon and HTH transcriptional regulator